MPKCNLLRKLRSKLFCSVNVSGQVDVMCFDKTGTLTEEGLSVFGLHACSDRAFHDGLESDITKAPLPLMWVMAACHSLNLHDGKYIGDPLDIQMFESTSWVRNFMASSTYAYLYSLSLLLRCSNIRH
jgi:cation-transporting ATPase 13A3/4/5